MITIFYINLKWNCSWWLRLTIKIKYGLTFAANMHFMLKVDHDGHFEINTMMKYVWHNEVEIMNNVDMDNH